MFTPIKYVKATNVDAFKQKVCLYIHNYTSMEMNPLITCHDVWLTEILLKMVLNTYKTYPDLEDNYVRQTVHKGD